MIKRPNRWNDGRRAILRKLWFEGAMVKAIVRETEMSAASVKEERARMELPARNRPGQVKAHSLTIYFDEALWATMQRAAFGRSASMPNYIRALVMRDCGRPQTNSLTQRRGIPVRVARGSDDHGKTACGSSLGPRP